MLVRYVDDAVVMCDTREQAEAALARLTVLLAGLGLEPKAAKTRIVQLAEGNPGFDFLGFHHRLVRGRTPKSAHPTFLARWPSRKAAQHARDRIREITGRERLLVPAEVIVTELNRFLRGSPGVPGLLHDVAVKRFTESFCNTSAMCGARCRRCSEACPRRTCNMCNTLTIVGDELTQPRPARSAGSRPMPVLHPERRRAGLGTSATETRPASLARSGTTPLAARAVVVQKRQPPPRLAVGRNPGAAIPGPPGPDQAPSNRHPAQALPGLAREGRTPPVKNVGKPCAGEPHARCAP